MDRDTTRPHQSRMCESVHCMDLSDVEPRYSRLLETLQDGSCDSGTDLDILRAVRHMAGEDWQWHDRESRTATCSLRGAQVLMSLPRYTDSIDAALRVVPGGCGWGVETFEDEAMLDSHRAWVSAHPGAAPRWHGQHRHSPALALCMAALWARDEAGV